MAADPVGLAVARRQPGERHRVRVLADLVLLPRLELHLDREALGARARDVLPGDVDLALRDADRGDRRRDARRIRRRVVAGVPLHAEADALAALAHLLEDA